MPKLLMKISSKFGNVVAVIKHNDEYLLFAGEKVMMRKNETDENGVTAIKLFTDFLLVEGWNYEMV